MPRRIFTSFLGAIGMAMLVACTTEPEVEPSLDARAPGEMASHAQALEEQEPAEAVEGEVASDNLDAHRELSGSDPIPPDPDDRTRAADALALVQADVDALEAIRGTMSQAEFRERVQEARCRHYGCPPPPEAGDFEALDRAAAREAAFQRDVDALRQQRSAYTDVEWDDLLQDLYCEHVDCDALDEDGGTP